jgi:hypothetical protein
MSSPIFLKGEGEHSRFDLFLNSISRWSRILATNFDLARANEEAGFMGADRMFRTPFYGRRGTHTMARRYRDTELWKKKWYRALGSQGRDLWNYLHDNCDSAGFFEIDCERHSFDLGFEVTYERILQVLRGKFIPLDGGDKLFLPAFVTFQYGELSELSKPHASYIKRIKANGVWDEYQRDFKNLSDLDDSKSMESSPKGIDTLKEKETYTLKESLQDQEKEKEPAPEINFVEAKEVMASLTDIKNPDGLVNHWNTVLAPKGYPLAPFHLGTTYTKKFFYISKLIKESGSSWLKYVGDFEASEFLSSKRNGGKPGITWLLEEKNFVDVLAGKYPAEGKQLKERLNNLRLE